MSPDDWFHRLPKVELHLHLEGAISLEALWPLIEKYGGDPDVPDPSALEERFRYRDRIGHGTRAAEDERLVDHLAERRVPLEMCPGSNVRTGVVADLASHPIRDFMKRGVVVTVNTDDPAMFGNSLAGEYRALADLGVARRDILGLARNAIEYSWADPESKRRLSEGLGAFA